MGLGRKCAAGTLDGLSDHAWLLNSRCTSKPRPVATSLESDASGLQKTATVIEPAILTAIFAPAAGRESFWQAVGKTIARLKLVLASTGLYYHFIYGCWRRQRSESVNPNN